MTPEAVLELGRQAMSVTSMLAAPLLLSALAVGLLIGMFQAATQIQDMTLSFIPKLIILMIAITLAGPWMLDVIVNFTRELFLAIPSMVN